MTKLSAEERRQWLEAQYPVWPRRTLAEHFAERAARFGSRPMFITESKVYTYAEAWEEARAYAKALLGMGVQRRDHVAVLMANEPEYGFLMMAIWMVGAVCVPVNTMLREDEVRYLLQQSESRWMFMHQSAGGVLHSQSIANIYDQLVHREDGGKLERVVCIQNTDAPLDERFTPWDAFVVLGATVSDQALDERMRQSSYPDEVADIIYTSGSTGMPKGVMLTHDMFLRCAFSSALSRAFEEGRRVFTALPLYHVFALVEGWLTSSFVGGAMIMVPGFVPQQALQMMEQHRANDVLCVPSMLVALLNHPDVENRDFSSLYALMCAAAPAPVTVWQRAIEVFQLTEICTAYGGTEATAATVHTEVGDPIETVVTRVGRIKPGGSSGMPEFGGANVQYKTVDPFTGEDLPPGTIGELTVRGNFITKGYYKKPEETNAVIDKDGWFRSGDLGRIDENGYLELLGRSKELYKISGENVAPKEVEDVINQHPAIAQAYVVGVPDALTTETGAAFIELKPGAACSRREVIDYCAQRLAKFKVPRYVWFVRSEEWPMTGTGKIQKFRLREIAEQKLRERGRLEAEA